jgi:hypothetical protein
MSLLSRRKPRMKFVVALLLAAAAIVVSSRIDVSTQQGHMARNRFGPSWASLGPMSDRTSELSIEAREIGKRAAVVIGTMPARDHTLDSLRHAVTRAVRTSTAEVDRDGAERLRRHRAA